MRISWVDAIRHGAWTAALLFVQLWHYVGFCVALTLGLVQLSAIAGSLALASVRVSHHFLFAMGNVLWAGSFLLLFFGAYFGCPVVGMRVEALRIFDV